MCCDQISKQAQLGVPYLKIQVEFGFILKAGTCKILNFTQNPRQSPRYKIKLPIGGGDSANTF